MNLNLRLRAVGLKRIDSTIGFPNLPALDSVESGRAVACGSAIASTNEMKAHRDLCQLCLCHARGSEPKIMESFVDHGHLPRLIGMILAHNWHNHDYFVVKFINTEPCPTYFLNGRFCFFAWIRKSVETEQVMCRPKPFWSIA